MSNISDTHNIAGYISGTTKPFAGQRLATVTYKIDKKTGIKPASVCASIPAVAASDINVHIAADTILQMYCCSLFAPLHSTVFITSLYSISLISVVCGIEPAGLAVADRADLVPAPEVIAL